MADQVPPAVLLRNGGALVGVGHLGGGGLAGRSAPAAPTLATAATLLGSSRLLPLTLALLTLPLPLALLGTAFVGEGVEGGGGG